MTRFGGTRALTAVLIALLVPIGTAQRATALDPPNEAPDIVLPVDGDTDEDSPYNFVNDAITLTDPDAGTDDVRLDLSVTSGVLHVADTTGLTFVDGTTNDSDTLAMTGSLSAFDAALDLLQLMPAQDDTDTVTLTALADDLGHNGDGGPQTDSDTMDITINPVNDAPVVTVPGTQPVAEDGVALLSAATSNAVVVGDVDAGGSDVQLTLAGSSGKVTLATTAGLSFSAGDGTADPTMTFTGTLTALNTALDGMTFNPDANFAGTANLSVDADDLGNTGAGGSATDHEDVSFDVSAVDDPPVNVVPSGVGTYAGVPAVLASANLNAVSVSDLDLGGADIQVALAATHGTLQLGSTAGVTIVAGANGTASVTIAGTLSNITAALDGLTFSPAGGFTGQAQVQVQTDDLGHTGSGGPLTDTDVFSVAVDAPTDSVYWTASKDTPNSLPASLSRAALDGSGGANLVTGPELQDIPTGVAIDAVGGRIYWADTGAFPPTTPGIWSAKLDGTGKQLFLSSAMADAAGTKLTNAFGMVVDQRTRRLYWANSDNVTPANRGISWVSLDNTSVGGRLDLTGATVGSPRALAIDTVHDRVYFTNWSVSQSIAWAALDGSAAGTFAVTGAAVTQPQGIAYDAATDRLFWTNSSGGAATDRVKVATLPSPFDSNITGSTFSIAPLAGGGLRATAIDPVGGRLYFGNTSTNQISFAQLDGSGGGADLSVGTAFAKSPDGMAILRHPAASGVPTLTGTPTVGQTLTCGTVIWTADDIGGALYRAPATTGVSWTLDGTTITGATGSTLTASSAGIYRCARTATNFAGTTSAQSAPLTVGTPAPKLTLSAGSVAVSGTGHLAVPVSCANATCSGTLALQSGGSALGSGTISVATGASGAVSIDLTAAGRALVSSRPSVDVIAVMTVTGASTTARALTLTSARAPAVKLRTGKAHVRAGKARVKLSCGSDGPCSVSYVLTATIGGHAKTLATAQVDIAAGATKTLKLKLAKAVKKALRKGAVTATQTATSDIAVGVDSTATASLKLVT